MIDGAEKFLISAWKVIPVLAAKSRQPFYRLMSALVFPAGIGIKNKFRFKDR